LGSITPTSSYSASSPAPSRTRTQLPIPAIPFSCRLDDLRCCDLPFEDGDPPLKLLLLFEQIEKCWIVSEVAVRARFPQALV
jgi:hypothetical protein